MTMKKTKKLMALVLSLAMILCLLPANVFAAGSGSVTKVTDVTSWTAVFQNDADDPMADQQTGSGSVSQDIVGDHDYPSVFYYSDEDVIVFRIRVTDVDGGTSADNYQFKSFAFVGMDVDLDGTVDLFVGAYAPHSNTGRLAIYPAGGGANISPSTTTIGKPVKSYQPKRGTNYSITPTGDGSNFHNTTDYFVTFMFTVNDINDALKIIYGDGDDHFTPSTPFRFYIGTAAQDNSLNQDLNGANGGVRSSTPWSQMDVESDPVTSDPSAMTFVTVIFDENTGDQVPNPASLIRNSASDIRTIPTGLTKRGGYYFQGFNTKRDGTGETVSASTNLADPSITPYISENNVLRVYAQWSNQLPYNVTFNANGGTVNGGTTTTLQTIGGIIGDRSPSAEKSDGSPFLGWYTSASGGSLYDPFETVTSDLTVYAQWGKTNQNHSTATYWDNSGSVKYAFIQWNGQNPNTGFVHPRLPDRQNQRFAGWATSANQTSPASGLEAPANGADYTTAPSGNKTTLNYYAVWEDIEFSELTITFNKNTTDTVSDMPSPLTRTPTSEGLFGPLPSEPKRDGYEFVEWNLSTDGTGEKIFATTAVNTNITVYAIWREVRADESVTFDCNIDPDCLADTYYQSQTISLDASGKLNYYPDAPVLDDDTAAIKTFMGWMTTATGTAANVNIYGVLTGGATYYALWQDVYNVTFYSNGGEFETTDPDLKYKQVIATAYGSVLYNPDDPVREGCTFAGWNTKPDGSGDSFDCRNTVTGNIVVYAQWEPAPEKIVITFDTQGGTLIPSDVINKNTAITRPTDPTKEGSTFGGWYSEAACTNEWDFDTTVSENTTIYAKWNTSATTYTVEFDVQGHGTAPSDITGITGGTTITTPDAPSADYYTFGGWYKEAACTNEWNFDTDTVTEDTTIYAK